MPIPTVCSTPADTLPAMFGSSLTNVTTIVLTPGAREVILQLPAATGAVQLSPVPSVTVTTPVGEPGPVTLHVTGYAWPTNVLNARAALFVIVAVVTADTTV